MYCPSCGKEVSSGLSFCNFCGVRLGAENDPKALSESSFNALVGASIGIPIAGLGIIIALMAVMKKGLDFPDGMIFAVILMTFLLLFIAELGAIWLMISRTRKPKTKAAKEPAVSPQKSVNEIGPVAIKGLNSSTFEGIPSVTEHTTRTLDPVHRRSSEE
jgi:hypothetical protein